MNETKEWEMQLRSWGLRPPSAKLKRRLFARQAAAAPTNHLSSGFRLAWLVPATAAFLLVCVLFNQHNSGPLSGRANSRPMVASILSNQNAAAYFPGNFEHQPNRLLSNTFEWTNDTGSTSSIRSLSGSRGTN